MGRWKGEGGRNNGANTGINFVAGCHAQKNIEGGQVMGEGTNGIAVNWGVLKWYSSWCCPGKGKQEISWSGGRKQPG